MKKRVAEILFGEARPERVAPRLIALRETLSLSPSEFADSVGLDRSSLTKIEAGERGLPVGKAVAICNLYGVGLNYIYRGDLSDMRHDLRQRMMIALVTAQARLPGPETLTTTE